MRSVHRKTKRVRRCDALEGRRRGPRTRRTRREIAETARHVQRRSRGAPGRVATRDTPGLGVGTPRVPTPGTVTDPPTPSRSTSAARGTRVAPNEEACRTTPDFGKKFVKQFRTQPSSVSSAQRRRHELPHPRQVQTGLDEPQEYHHRRWLEVRPSRERECHETRRLSTITRLCLVTGYRRGRIFTVFLRARSRAHRHAIVAREARATRADPASFISPPRTAGRRSARA